jgi:hypothetical protein
VQKQPSNAESRKGQTEGERWHRRQGAHIARTDALSGAAYAALLIAVLLVVWAIWSRLR